MSALDVVYTTIYETSYPRTKFQYLRSLKNKKIDYIFIGSSRVENSIVPSVIYDKTGKIAVNLGFQAAKLVDIYTVLQLVKEYNIQYETVLIQVDYIYNIKNGHSNILEYEMMPFIRDNAITRRYSDCFSKNPFANYYIPFYRYCNNDLKLGLRELFANLIHKKTNIIPNRGYGAKYGNSEKMQGSLPDIILDRNAVFDSIQFFVKKNNMNVVFYCAPFCENNKNKNFTSKLNKKIPGLKDFSELFKEDNLFLDCNHLNDSGANRFTEIFAEEVLIR
ncbi:MAG: hypothetical protein ACI87N_002213 [Flavobacteriales bacterium]|jgi:hypothetical protein